MKNMGKIEKRLAAVCLIVVMFVAACAQTKAPPPPDMTTEEEFNRPFIAYETVGSMPYTEKNKRSRYFMFLGQGFDLGTTVYALSTGKFEEGNPIGFVGVVVAKVVVMGFTYYWVEVKCAGDPKQQKMRDKYYRTLGWAGVIPGTWNTIQILRAN